MKSAPSNETSPASGGSAFQWTGASANDNWTTPGNWLGGVAPTGSANETLIFPAGASQFTSVDNFPAGSNFFYNIIVSGAGYSFTIDNNLALGAGGLLAGGAGSDTISGLSNSVEIFLAADLSFDVLGGATLVVNPEINELTYTLTVTGGGAATLNGVIAGSGGLVVTSSGTVTLNGANTYTGPTLIDSGTVNLVNNTALGANSDVTIAQGATVAVQGAVTPGVGLMGQYYNVTPSSNDFVDYPTLEAYISGLTPSLTELSSTTSLDGNFDFGDTGSAFPSPYNANATDFVAVYTGLFDAATAGSYTFDTGSDDGSMIFIDGATVVNNNNFQGVTVNSGTVTLTAGEHNIVIAYYQGGGGYALYADVQVPGGTLERLPDSLLSAVAPTNVQIGSLTGAGTIQLGANQITVGGDGNSSEFTGFVSGSGNLAKTGAGTLVLSQPQYTGTTTISGGTLQFGDGVDPLSALPTSSITDNSTLVLANPTGATLTAAQVISGIGGLTVTGGGTLNLNAVNTYQGPTLIAAGIVNALDNAALGNNSAVTVDTGATVNFSGLVNTGLSGTYYNAAPNNPDSNAFDSLTTLTAYVASLPVITTDSTATSNGQNDDGNYFDYGTTGEGFPATILNNPNQFVAVWTGEFDAQVTGTYTFDTGSDDGSMIFIDGNVVVNNNAYQGVTVRSGSVALTQGYHNIVIAYYQGGGGYGMYADVQVPGGSMQPLPNALLVDSNSQIDFGSLAGGGNIYVSSSTVVTVTVGANNSSTVYSGILSGFAALTKVGSGTLTLANTNSYLGSTAIDAGTLILAANDALGQNNDSGIVVNTGGALAFSGGINYTTAEPLTVSGSGPAGSASGLIDGNFTTPSQGSGYTYDPTGSAWTFTGGAVLQGNGSVWGFPNTPAGSQSAALQNNPSQGTGDAVANISQTFTWPAGTDTISFYLCERPGYPTLPVNIEVDGTIVDTVTNTASTWTLYSTTFTTNGGSHTLTFNADLPGASDNDTGLWGVSVTGAGNGAIENLSGNSSFAGPITVSGATATIGSDSGTLTLSGNVNLAAGNLTATGAGQITISGVISGSASSGTTPVQGLVGTYFNIGANQDLIQPASSSNSAWLGNQTPAHTALLIGPIDFPNISANGFADSVGDPAYYNLGNGNNNNVEARWYGDIVIPGTGTTPVPINFRTGSDDGSMLYVDGVAVVNNNFFQGQTFRSGLVDLTPGLHTIDIEFYNGAGGASMIAQWDPTGGTNFADIPNSAFLIPGVNGVTKTGTGTLTLSGANTYAGTTTVNAGVLSVSADANLGVDPASATPGNVVLNGGTLLASASFTLNSNRGIALGDPVTPSTGGEIDVAAGATLTYAGVIANNAGGGDGLTVGSGAHTGTVILSNTETYTGATAVNAGTLQLSGHVSAQSTVTVAAGAAIDGTGTYAGSVNVDGTIEAGTPATTGILTTGSLTFGSGTLDVQMNGTTAGSGYDQVSANGVNLTGATLVAALGTGFNPAVGTSFKIISNTSNNPVTSTFVGQPQGSVIMIGGLPFTISYVGGDGNDVVLTRVASTTTTLTSNPVGPITLGTSITFTATIANANPGNVGTVSFYYNYGQPGQFQIGGAVNVSGGSATSAATTALPAGSDTITAIYSGGPGFAGSQGTLVIQVNSANQTTTTSVTSNPVGPITQGTSVDFTATISGSPGVGTVSFYDNFGQSGQFQIGSAVNVSPARPRRLRPRRCPPART